MGRWDNDGDHHRDHNATQQRQWTTYASLFLASQYNDGAKTWDVNESTMTDNVWPFWACVTGLPVCQLAARKVFFFPTRPHFALVVVAAITIAILSDVCSYCW